MQSLPRRVTQTRPGSCTATQHPARGRCSKAQEKAAADEGDRASAEKGTGRHGATSDEETASGRIRGRRTTGVLGGSQATEDTSAGEWMNWGRVAFEQEARGAIEEEREEERAGASIKKGLLVFSVVQDIAGSYVGG